MTSPIEYAVATATKTGVKVTMNATVMTGDYFKNNGKTLLIYKNSTTPSTAVVDRDVECSLGTKHDVTITIGASKYVVAGPFNDATFGDSADSYKVDINSYTSTTGVTVGAVKLA